MMTCNGDFVSPKEVMLLRGMVDIFSTNLTSGTKGFDGGLEKQEIF